MNEEKKKAIKKHFDKQIRNFKKEALKLAIEKDYPYIENILRRALRHMERNAEDRGADIRCSEYFFMNF